MAKVYSGVEAPEYIDAVLSRGDTTYDFTEVTGGCFCVRKQGGQTEIWPASVVTSTTSSVTLRHVFAPSETQVLGRYDIYAKLNLTGGVLRVPCEPLDVVDPYKP